MIILAINAGSTSVKFLLQDTTQNISLMEGICKEIRNHNSSISLKNHFGISLQEERELSSYEDAVHTILNLMSSGETKVLESLHEIDAVAHRIAMGGVKYDQTVFFDEQVQQDILSSSKFVPLHNHAQLAVIGEFQKALGDATPMIAGFDTAFHAKLPKSSYTLPIPYEYEKDFGLRRFGFHGLSLEYIMERFNVLNNLKANCKRIVACHLGGGVSVTPLIDGIPVDTIFGSGTGEGCPSSTRAGSFDYTAMQLLHEETNQSYEEIINILHKKSGLLGISQLSGDCQVLEKAVKEGHERAELALTIMAKKIKKYIGGFAFDMGGLDAILLTGGIGEHSSYMREKILSGLEAYGIELDLVRNENTHGTENRISTDASPVSVWVIPTNEEFVLLRDSVRLLEERQQSSSKKSF